LALNKFYSKPNDLKKGTQIDLVMDRQDNCINLCEMKFSLAEFTIDKKYAEELQRKKRIFWAQTKVKKSVFISMWTPFGVKNNGYFLSTAQNQFRMDILFEKTN
jgi:uncharacterized protein